LSKKLSWILRHGAGELGLHMDKEGFVSISELLNTRMLKDKQVTLMDIQKLAEVDKKQRYAIKSEPNPNANANEASSSETKYWIRANQGHSLKSEGTIELDFEHLLKDLTIAEIEQKKWTEVICHGTNLQALKEILKSRGLNRMSRTHIHFSCGDSLDGDVKSGMRSDCELLIYVDAIQAIKDGVRFQISTNNVILSSGDNQGFVDLKYIWKIAKFAHGKPGKILWDKNTSDIPLGSCLE